MGLLGILLGLGLLVWLAYRGWSVLLLAPAAALVAAGVYVPKDHENACKSWAARERALEREAAELAALGVALIEQPLPADAADFSLARLAKLDNSTSGEYDLLAKVYVPEDEDVGHYLSERLFDIPGINRTLTTMTFRAF